MSQRRELTRATTDQRAGDLQRHSVKEKDNHKQTHCNYLVNLQPKE